MNNGELMYKPFTLSDEKVVELLIMFRYKYDKNMHIVEGVPDMAAGTGKLNEEMIVTYADLDNCIKLCNFNDSQITTIKMLEEGYTLEEIANTIGAFPSTMDGRISTICKAIVRQNEWLWRKSMYKHKLGLKDKICTRCRQRMPATWEFYSENNYSRDGFLSICRNCRN